MFRDIELLNVFSTELNSHRGKCSFIRVDKHRSVRPMYLLPQIFMCPERVFCL